MSSLSVRPAPLGENTKENQRPKNTKAGVPKRSALGNVTNQVRVQPVRAAKDKHSVLQGFSKSGQENVPLVQKKSTNAGSSTFAIFEDVPKDKKVAQRIPAIHEPMNDQENLMPEQNLRLTEAVVGLKGASLKPLAPLHIDVEPLDVSPMAVDSPSEPKSPENRDEFGLDPYYEDIYTYLRSIEGKSRPERNYMNRQSDVTTSMRNILVDWLVEVGEEYKLHRETLFLAISYIDKFLSLVGVHRPKLQLVGTAAMFIAAKYEEIYPPDVGEFVYITDDTYTRSQVLKMESVILKLLEFKVSMPTINWFCERFMASFGSDELSKSVKNLAFFLTELSLIEIEQFLDFPPSMIAASAVALARNTCGIADPWTSNLQSVSRYSLADLRKCISCLYKLHCNAKTMPQQAVIEKYKNDKYNQVSTVMPPAVLTIV